MKPFDGDNRGDLKKIYIYEFIFVFLKRGDNEFVKWWEQLEQSHLDRTALRRLNQFLSPLSLRLCCTQVCFFGFSFFYFTKRGIVGVS